MPSLSFYQLDVFTDTPLAGNALAVFPDARDVEQEIMQALAREMNLSETTFVLPSQIATRRVRIFTPEAEIPLAGHPTIGTWWLLADLGLIDLPADGITGITQETGAGILPVDIHMEHGQPIEVVMTQARPEFQRTVPDIGRLADALGGAPDIIAAGPTPQVVSTALPQLMVPIASLEALTQLPRGGGGPVLAAMLREVGTDCVMCFVLESASKPPTARCRMFAPGLGVPEDPATGSAAGALGAYLVRHDMLPMRDGAAHLVVDQGREINRPSRISVEVSASHGDVAAVRVGGRAVTIIRGEVTL